MSGARWTATFFPVRTSGAMNPFGNTVRLVILVAQARKLFVAALVGLAGLAGADVAASPFRAGVAVRVVTPDPLLPVSGGVGPAHAVTRKQGELTVRALVLQKDETQVAIVGADFLGFPAVLGNRVRAKVRSIRPENILIGVTHTHSAPDCYGFPDGQGGFAADLKYLDWVCSQMADCVNEAVSKLQPASLKVGSGEAQGKIAYNYYAEQLYDPRCHVIQAVGEDGKAIATLVNYAIHPEVLGSDQGILSPDLVGPLYDRIEKRGGGTAVFMNSAQGGMVTADCRGPNGRDVQTWAECVRIGTLLADEALRIVEGAPVQADPNLFCASAEVTFPIDSPLLKAVLKGSPLGYAGQGEDAITTRLNLLNLGNAQILTIPGEAMPNIGFYLKRKMRGEHNLLFGLTNDAFGYILTREDWGSFKRYEYVSRTSLGERTGPILVEEALKLVQACPQPEKRVAR